MQGKSLPNLRKLREARGWTQEQLSVECGVSDALISAYENGTRSLTWKSLARIAEALGVYVTDLVSEEGVATVRSVELLEEILLRVNREYDGEDKQEVAHLIELLRLKLHKMKN